LTKSKFIAIKKEHVFDINIPLRVIAVFPSLPREFKPIDLARISYMSENTARKVCQRLANLKVIEKKPKSKSYVKIYDKFSDWLKGLALKIVLDAEKRGVKYVELEDSQVVVGEALGEAKPARES